MKNLKLNIVNPQPQQVVIDQDPDSKWTNYVVLS